MLTVFHMTVCQVLTEEDVVIWPDGVVGHVARYCIGRELTLIVCVRSVTACKAEVTIGIAILNVLQRDRFRLTIRYVRVAR